VAHKGKMRPPIAANWVAKTTKNCMSGGRERAGGVWSEGAVGKSNGREERTAQEQARHKLWCLRL
jgi:hypothetical protein